MNLEKNLLAIGALILVLLSSTANAVEHHRYVRLILNESQISEIQSGGMTAVELNTGWSEHFVPAQLTYVDMLTLRVEFFDEQGNQLFIMLRDLGGGYLNDRGHQWFQVGLALDRGTVSGTYVNGWGFYRSQPYGPFNAACCTRSVSNASTIEATFGFDVTNSTMLVETARFQFNFNSYNNPVVITDGGGFNRMYLTIRSESIALIRKPYSEMVVGPYDDSGVAIDIDNDGRYAPFGGDQKVAVGYDMAQHFIYPISVYPAIPNKSEFSYPVFLPEGFEFDPLGEEVFDGCRDGICDGLATSSLAGCVATISGPRARKNQVESRNLVLEILDEFSGNWCGVRVYMVTKAATKGRDTSYGPKDCQTAIASDGSSVDSLIRLTNGYQIYDKVTDTLLPGNYLGEMEAYGCP